METKIIAKSSAEARNIIRNAVDKVGNVVRKTLGPAGRNVLVDRGDWKTPRITNDGVFIAKNYKIDDPAEGLVARILVQAAERTNEIAGDGTTTAIVIARKLIDTVFTEISEHTVEVEGAELDMNTGTTLMEYKRQITEAHNKVAQELEKKAKKVKSKEELGQIALCSMENPEIAKVIAEIVWKIGIDGYVGVEEGFHGLIETDVIEGMQKRAKLAAPFMVTSQEKKEAVISGSKVLITSYAIEGLDKLMAINELCNRMIKDGKRQLVIMAPKFDKAAVTWAAQSMKQGFRTYLIRVPSLTEQEGGELEDVAVYLGAKLYEEQKGHKFEKIKLEDLGEAKKIIVSIFERNMVIMEGLGKEAAKERTNMLKAQIEMEKSDIWKKKLKERIASLSSGIGIIKVGAATDAETGYIKLKVEDAIYATKAALEEGYVKGGGLALKEIAEKLPDNILTEALKAPYEQIQENAGGKLDITDTVIDPVKVTRVALLNACSVAATLITSDSILVEKEIDIAEKLREALGLQKHNDPYIGGD